MSLSRRRFLEVGTIVAATSAVTVPMQAFESTGAALAAAGNKSSFHFYSAERFQTLVGTHFTVDTGLGRPVTMRLEEVEPFAEPRNQRVTGECFGLRFAVVRGSQAPQGSYVFHHATAGSDTLLIVPSHRDPLDYLAVINHRHRAAVV
jgi:hypothetical protein